MTQFLNDYWLVILIVALVAAPILWWAVANGGRRHVSLRSEDLIAVARPTLDRSARPGQEPINNPSPTVATPVAGGDDLLLLKGVGPRLASLLNEQGITRFAQIAAWTEADIAAIDTRLGAFAGRIQRDRWIEQARFLAEGDQTGFEKAFGRLDGGPL